MQCNDYESLISRFLDGEILLREKETLDVHLAACEGCRKKLETWKSNDAVLKETLTGLSPSAKADWGIAMKIAQAGKPGAAPGSAAPAVAAPAEPTAPPGEFTTPTPAERAAPAPALQAPRPAPAAPAMPSRRAIVKQRDDDTGRYRRSSDQDAEERVPVLDLMRADVGRIWGARTPYWVGAAAVLLLCLWMPIKASMLRVTAADTTDLIVVAPGDFYVQSQAAVRVVLRDGETLAPAPGIDVDLALLEARTNRAIELGTFKTGSDGCLEARVDVPDLPPGNYMLQVRAKNAHGDILVQPVRVVRTHKLLISTDKPIYQPNQIIHARLMALRTHDLKPESGEEVLFEIEDPKQNKVFKKSVKTTAYGLAALDFQLADEINMGEYRLRATMGEVVSERVVEVKRYVLPKFKITLDPGKSFYLAGEKLHGKVQADYFFGKPVAGGKIKLGIATFEAQFRDLAKLEGETDASGAYTFDYDLPSYFAGVDLEKGKAMLKLEVSLKDTADHEEKKVVMVPISDQAIQIEVVHESGDLVPEVENVFYVVTSYPDGSPARTQVKVDGIKLKQQFETSDLGVARVAVTPQRFGVDMDVEARDARGNIGALRYSTTRSQQIRGQAPFLVRTDKAVYRCGETMQIETVGRPGFYYVDVVRNGETVLTRTLEVRSTSASTTVDLPGDAFGAVVVHAYQIGEAGHIERSTRRVLVQVPENLRIEAKLDKETYKPGETATIDFAVTDETGKALPSALSCAIVDEAVFALHDNQPGLEKVYFALEQELQQPKYSIKCSPVDLKRAVLGDAIDEAGQLGAAVALAGLGPIEVAKTSPLRTFPEKQHEILRLRAQAQAEVAEVERGLWRGALGLAVFLVVFGLPGYVICRRHGVDWALTYSVGTFLCGLGAVAVGAGAMMVFGVVYTLFLFLWIVGESVGSWKAPMTLVGGFAGISLILFVGVTVFGQKIARLFKASTSSLDAGSPETSAQSNRGMINTQFTLSNMEDGGGGGGGGGGFAPAPAGISPESMTRGSGVHDAMGAKAVPEKLAPFSGARKDVMSSIRVRQYFPETMFWAPNVVTDLQGKARLTVPLADSITTWRMTLQGVSREGKLGGGTRGLTVFQDFFIDIDFPVALTQGDEVSVPIAVFNYLKTDQSVELSVEKGDWFELQEEAQKTVALGPGEVKGTSFRLKVTRLGQKALTVYAVGSQGFHDAIKRTVAVVPNGKMYEVSFSRRLATAAETITIPREAIDEGSAMFLKLYPGAISQVVDGLERLIQMPYG